MAGTPNVQSSRERAAPGGRPVRTATGVVVAETPETPVPPGLVYVSDAEPGIRRIRKGDNFFYKAPDGRAIRREAELKRIRSLAIPPAYEDVWICPLPNGHLQATGRDARGRKQYRYHPEWRLARDTTKFERMLEFGAALPRIRRRVKADLEAPVGSAPGRLTVLATIVRLLDTTLIRVGNDEYARTNKSYGLTTLRTRHVEVERGRIQLRFRGKSGVTHEVALEDPRVAKVVRRCQTMPGQELFQYQDDDGERHTVGSGDVNDYIREASGADFTAKDFRTWHGSVHALDLWLQQADADTEHRLTANQLIGEVAKRLGNTVAVCRKSYIHPRVLEALGAEHADVCAGLQALRRPGLDPAERRFLAFLTAAA
ncbi:DNA topoisomerase IB [Piscinibacter koreensis]|uniref:DNA topoisomerase n=1 Tax=Piscinibacter koreensis TaxID=2742824 RepID=A0A7Y6NKN0_9BURK|nr:DNA topoisomerase IB [Schlegelella koreensis]NUZ04973.1 DNA topoisomerase IB [Schlegelella koreensis]